MGSSSHRKAKSKRTILNEDIATYRGRDKVNHRRKRQGILNVNQVDDVLIEGEIKESHNEYVQLENENVPNDNDNVGIENLENEILPGHNVNCMIDHDEHDNAHKPYISPNYN